MRNCVCCADDSIKLKKGFRHSNSNKYNNTVIFSLKRKAQLPFAGFGVLELAGAHALTDLVGAHALMRGNELVKPARIVGGPIKGLHVSKKNCLYP